MKLLDFIRFQNTGTLCSLCNELIKSELASPSSCEHPFHVECLESWVKTNKSDCQSSCPLESCGRKFTAISIRKTINGPVYRNISLAIDTQCPICCEDIQPPIATPESCNHHFCLSCLNEWCKIRHECPLDRGPFDLILLSLQIDGPIFERRTAPPAYQPPPEEEDTTSCEICQSPEDEEHLLLCDSCDKGYHTYCLPSPLSSIPDGDWFCPDCEEEVTQNESTQERRRSRRNRTARTRYANSLADEDDEYSESDNSTDDFTPERRTGYLSTASQRRLRSVAERRHRGTGLLRDLIDQLMRRTAREQTDRQQNRRRRVRLSTDSVLPQTPSVQITPKTSPKYLTSQQSARISDSEPDSPLHLAVRHRARVRLYSNDSIGQKNPTSSTTHLTEQNAQSVASSHTNNISDNGSNSTSNICGTMQKLDAGENCIPSTSVELPNLAETSNLDLFASFADDPSLVEIANDIRAISSQRSKKRPSLKRGKFARRKKINRKRNSSKYPPSIRKKRLVFRKLRHPTRCISKRVVSTRPRSNVPCRPLPPLSILGAELHCGRFTNNNDRQTEESEKICPVTSSSCSIQNVSSTSLLRRLEESQASLFKFNTFNMQLNPDNSVSPRKISCSDTVSTVDVSKNLPHSLYSNPNPTIHNGDSNYFQSSSKKVDSNSSSSVSHTFVNSSLTPFTTRCTQAQSSPLSWTSPAVSTIRGMLNLYMSKKYTGLVNKDIREKILQRALSKITAKPVDRVPEAKMRKLVDDYVQFYLRRPTPQQY